MQYSFIIPVYNRPDEFRSNSERALQSSTYIRWFWGSSDRRRFYHSSESICQQYQSSLSITYLAKPNTGPGDSRNYGMRCAKYDYFLILDSDCLLPPHYLEAVDDYLQAHYVDCFGGADTADEHFTKVQKAINYTMTSFFTTGGIRGSARGVQRFEPRSFNMGLSRGGFWGYWWVFGKIHPGEDPDFGD